MRKNPFLLMMMAISMLLSVSFTSCNDDDDDLDLNNPDVLNNLPYSNLTVEKQKEKLQLDANDLLNEIKDLNQLEALPVLLTFSHLMDISESGFNLSYAKDVIGLADFYATYTWDADLEDWVITENNSQSEFIFPVDNQTARITAKAVTSGFSKEIILGYYEYVWVGDHYEEVWVDTFNGNLDIPKQVNLKVYLANKEVASMDASADIKNLSSLPSYVELSLSAGNYSWTTKVTKASPNLAVSTLKKGKTVLLNAAGAVTGNLDEFLAEEDIELPASMTANAVVDIYGRLALAGNMNISQYAADMKVAEDKWNDEYDYDEGYCKAEAEAFNKNVDLHLISLKGNDSAKIASLTEKAKKYSGDNWWYTVPVLHFGDSTDVEAEVFFSSGFDSFINNFMEFLSSFDSLLDEEE